MQKNGAIKAPFYINYSFLIAANGLSFMALNEGINPAIIPITTAKTIADGDNHNGILQIAPVIPIAFEIELLKNVLIANPIP